MWQAASAIWGEANPERSSWADCHLDALWEGKVAEVLVELEQWRASGEPGAAALSYYSEHQARRDYATYRARGLQIGSGSLESAGKQLVSARLNQAGRIWDAAGAEAVASVRAWLKSERWEEAIALRSPRRRSYRRKQPDWQSERSEAQGQGAKEQAKVLSKPLVKGRRQELAEEVLAQVQEELAEQPGKNAWGKAGSIQRHRKLAAQREQQRPRIVV